METAGARASKVYRAPAQDFEIEFETSSGRKLSVFPDHRLKTDEGVKIARHVKEGDKLLTPKKVKTESNQIKHIDLIERLDSDDIVVRNDTESFNSMIDSLGGLKKAAEALSMSKKTLSNYRYRESVPMDILHRLSSKSGERINIQDEAVIAAKRDTVELTRNLEANSDFMKLLGYYAAEGYTRKSTKKGREFYQVCFAFGEAELKENMAELIENVFGVEPSEGDHILTVSSRIIFELFESLEIGSGAHEKRVPDIVMNSSDKMVSDFLSAYFAGDGSVEKGVLHVNATSVSRGLLQDIDLLLKRLGIFARYKTETRKAGGILLEKYGQRYERREFTSHKLQIRSSEAVNFGKKVGFDIKRKQKSLEEVYRKEGKTRFEQEGEYVLDEIKSREIKKSKERFMYDIEVEETHNFLTSENLVTNNCDGDEDAILLLMDGLLNFSRQFLPNMVGARTMDAPLILSTVLNPDEIDDEAWAIETVDEYPLQFYRETLEYKNPWDLECDLEIGEDVVYGENPFKHGFTHDTSSVENGPNQSEYVTLDEMSEKTGAQLTLGRKIMAVDENATAELLLKKHFIPDIKGNLRSFSKQKMRCVDCNEKFRRVPLRSQTIAPTGKTTAQCPECGGKVLLTISEGTIKKYMIPSEEIIEEYEISPYVRQQILILKETLQSLFGKEQRQSGLKQFT